MNAKSTKILLITKDTECHKEIKKLLNEIGDSCLWLEKQAFSLEYSENIPDGLKRIKKGGVNLILLEIPLPDYPKLHALATIYAKAKDIPIITLVGRKDMNLVSYAIYEGASDFLAKDFLDSTLLGHSILAAQRQHSLLWKLMEYQKKTEEILKRYNEELEIQLDEKKEFETVVQNMNEGIVICAPDWKIKEINSSAKKYLNIAEPMEFSLPEIMFNNYSASMPKEQIFDLSEPNKIFDLKRGELEKFKELYLEANLNILKNPLGEISSIVLTLRDVTNIRKEEMMKCEFLSLMSHKMRTPVAVITGSASMLHDGLYGPLNEKQKTAMDIISEKSFSLKGLIEKLLGFATTESHELSEGKEKINIAEYLPVFINIMIKQWKNKKIEIKYDFAVSNITIEMNKIYFDLIIGNLIENAVKFCDKEVVEIGIDIEKKQEEILIKISDNGPGIPPEEREKIFEKFYQIEKHFTGQIEGVGLGLALVKKLVTGLGGEIQVESKLNEGSVFSFTLPGLKDSV